MKRTLFALLILVILGCQGDQSPKTEIIISNLGEKNIDNLWISIEGSKTIIGTLKPGDHSSILLNAIGNKRIDYGFKGDEVLRNKMGGELFFFGNQIPSKAGMLEVGFQNGLIHSLSSEQKE